MMTGTRFGEATALTVADIDLVGKPATARINKVWKQDGKNQFYIGPTKTSAGKRTIGLNRAPVDLLIPLVVGRAAVISCSRCPKGNGRCISCSGAITGCQQ